MQSCQIQYRKLLFHKVTLTNSGNHAMVMSHIRNLVTQSWTGNHFETITAQSYKSKNTQKTMPNI